MKMPDKLMKKVQELAKEVAKHKMAASISIGKDEVEEDEEVGVEGDDLTEEDEIDPIEHGEHDNKLLSGIKNLLDSWQIRDTSSDAGRYYNDLKQLYEANESDNDL